MMRLCRSVCSLDATYYFMPPDMVDHLFLDHDKPFGKIASGQRVHLGHRMRHSDDGEMTGLA